MKIKTGLVSILLIAAILSCENDDSISTPTINGLSLYWDHEVFGDEGRRLRFEAHTTNVFDNDYQLVFNTSVEDKIITVMLKTNIDRGKCPHYPNPVLDYDPNKCTASGDFYLTDAELDNGIYSLRIIMPTFEVTSELIVTDEKVTLKIPANKYIFSSIENVYPIPKYLVYGSLVYQGSNNTNDAKKFLDDLTKLGLIQTTLPNYPYRYLSVDENGHPISGYWEPDDHSIEFLYKMNNTDFKTIFEESKKYFNQTNLNIYLYTSNGDQAIMDKREGITVEYAQ